MISLINGDALHIPLADGSVQCAITSPPYFGLRDYNVSGQIGLEQSPEENIEKMVQVFREVKRVLRDDGTLWLNIGDSYASGGKSGEGELKKSSTLNHGRGVNPGQAGNEMERRVPVPDGLKPKDLIGIPWMLAFALRADGWYLRSEIIWHKPNPMPESVTDRPTKSHEQVFLLSKSQRYYYDAEAVREPVSDVSLKRAESGWNCDRPSAKTGPGGIHTERMGERFVNPACRNRRTVWTIPTSPYKGSHFATFPPALVEPCLLAGTSERGCCPTCGAPWQRVVEKPYMGDGNPYNYEERKVTGNKMRLSGRELAKVHDSQTRGTTGWRASCTCPPAEPVPCTVLDPFAGTFTVGMVAMKHRRDAVGIELNAEYIELAKKRCSDIQIILPVSP